MSWIGGLISLGGSLLSSGASKDAASTQADAANRATDTQLQMFNTQNRQQAPYRQAGYTALGEIMKGFGLPTQGITRPNDRYTIDDFRQYNESNAPLTYRGTDADAQTQYDRYISGAPGAWNQSDFKRLGFRDLGPAGTEGAAGSGIGSGYFSHQFDKNDLANGLAPNYEFQLGQGLRAAKNMGNLQTGLISGNTLQGIQDYAQNYASGAYQQAFNNYTANQANIFNRLSTIAGLGSAANQQSAGLAGSMAPGISQSIQGAGAAQAAGSIGQANALAGGANNALGWYKLNDFMKPAGTPYNPDYDIG